MKRFLLYLLVKLISCLNRNPDLRYRYQMDLNLVDVLQVYHTYHIKP